MEVTQLALAFGSSLAAGFNLYLTVLTLGLLHRFEMLILPAGLEVLSHPWVLIAAGVLFLVEFVADKVPYVDNAWDAAHGLLRIPAGAILAAGAMAELPPHWLWIAALVGGFVSFSAHGAKATTRLAANTSPEPFSNWFLSLAEDVVSLGLLLLVAQYPAIALAASLVLLALCLTIILLLYSFFKRVFRRRSAPSAS